MTAFCFFWLVVAEMFFEKPPGAGQFFDLSTAKACCIPYFATLRSGPATIHFRMTSLYH